MSNRNTFTTNIIITDMTTLKISCAPLFKWFGYISSLRFFILFQPYMKGIEDLHYPQYLQDQLPHRKNTWGTLSRVLDCSVLQNSSQSIPTVEINEKHSRSLMCNALKRFVFILQRLASTFVVLDLPKLMYHYHVSSAQKVMLSSMQHPAQVCYMKSSRDRISIQIISNTNSWKCDTVFEPTIPTLKAYGFSKWHI